MGSEPNPDAERAREVTLARLEDQINWYDRKSTTYRGTCESLKHEKYLFLALAGPYATAASPQRMLAERVEGTVSVENAKWVAQETRPEKKEESRP